MKTMWVSPVILAVGCVSELEVTEDGAAAFVLANFDAESSRDLERVVSERLLPLMRAQLAGVEDPDDAFHDSWLATVPNLTPDDLGTLTVPGGAELSAIEFPTSRVRTSAFTVAEQRASAVVVNRICIESETTTWAERTFLSDPDCFADGSCEVLSVQQPTNKKNLLTEIWYDQFWDYRVVSIEDESGNTVDAMISRAYLDERWFSRNGNNSWDQLYQIDVTVDDADGNGSISWVGYWTSVQISGLFDSLFQGSVRTGLHQSALWAEHFRATGEVHPDCPNDRNAEKPERWENLEG